MVNFPTNSFISIKLIDVDMELAQNCPDYLVISGLGNSSLRLCSHTSYSLSNWTDIKVRDEEISFHFVSDYTQTGGGFMIHYNGNSKQIILPTAL